MSNSSAFVWCAVPSVKYALRFSHVCWVIIKVLCLSFGAVLAGGMNNSSGCVWVGLYSFFIFVLTKSKLDVKQARSDCDSR